MRAKSRLMLSLVKQLLVVIQEIASYDKAIRPLFLTHQDHELWSSLPRAGKHLAPRLLAEWGDDRSRYADATSVQSSGRHRSSAVPKWQVRQSAQTLCLRETTAQRSAPVRLAIDAARGLGAGLLPTQTGGGQNAQYGGARPGQRLGAHHLSHVGD